MGALVVRAYLGRPGAGRHAQAQRLVMLSPPNRGSVLAARFADWGAFRWLYGDAAKELSRDRVDELPKLPASAEVLVLAGGTGDPERGYNPAIPGDNDGVIAVSEMALPGAELRFVGGSHSLLQWRPAVLTTAMAFLASDRAASAG